MTSFPFTIFVVAKKQQTSFFWNQEREKSTDGHHVQRVSTADTGWGWLSSDPNADQGPTIKQTKVQCEFLARLT